MHSLPRKNTNKLKFSRNTKIFGKTLICWCNYLTKKGQWEYASNFDAYDKFSYASDYEIVTKLKALIDKYGICFLVVHHTRKMEYTDSFDMISGTNGLLGAFVMQKEKRTYNKAVLEVAGRDQQDQKLWLNFNRERCVWELTKTETELWKEPEDTVLEKIKELVTETTPEWAGIATELVEVLQV